jgi:arylsulfatase
MFGNRGIYHKGWTAVTKHRTPWDTGMVKTIAFDDDVWELYDTSKDWSQAKDLSKEQPEVLHRLQQLWLLEAAKYNVLPLDDRFAERGNSEIAGRPDLIKGNRQIVYGGLTRVPALAMVNMANKSFAVTAELDVPKDGAEGVIVAVGGVTGGWSLYTKEGKAKFATTSSALRKHMSRARKLYLQANIRSEWSSNTMEGASPRAEKFPCM